MFSAISRRIRILGCQSTAASSVRIRSFNMKAPRFNEKSLQQSSEQSSKQPHEQPHEKSHGQSHEQSAITMRGPRLQRTMLPARGAGRIPLVDVIACIHEGEMDEILLRHTTYLYRKFSFNEYTRFVWLYVRRPVAKLSYVAEIGSCKRVPEELAMLPYYNNRRMEALNEAMASREIRTINREAEEGTVGEGTRALPRMTFYAGDLRNYDVPGLPRYAFLINHLWEITWPTHGVTCEELWERRFLQSPPPPQYINAREQMLSYLPLGRQKMLF